MLTYFIIQYQQFLFVSITTNLFGESLSVLESCQDHDGGYKFSKNFKAQMLSFTRYIFSYFFHVIKHTVLEITKYLSIVFCNWNWCSGKKRNDFSHSDITCSTQDSHHTCIQFKCFIGYSPFSFCREWVTWLPQWIIIQFGTTALIKAAAVLPTIAFEPSVQMSTQWKKQVSLVPIKLFWPYKDLERVSGCLGAKGPYFESFCSRFMREVNPYFHKCIN